jgi:hypothetical protein
MYLPQVNPPATSITGTLFIKTSASLLCLPCLNYKDNKQHFEL